MNWAEKDWIDQPAHLLAGFFATLILSLPFSVWWSGLLAGCAVMAYAAYREYEQHPDVIIDKDLGFWFTGCVAAIGVSL